MLTQSPIVVRAAAAAGLSAGTLACLLVAASCSSEDKAKSRAPIPAPETSSSMLVTPGEAGGVLEETFTETAVVRGVDTKARTVTLENADGERATFVVPPEMRNLAQLRAGDRVRATVLQRLSVAVDKDAPTRTADGAATTASGAAATSSGGSHAAVVGRAPKGAKPGTLVAETFELVGTVTSIDTSKRKATIQFADGQSKTVPVRKDVDLSRYNAGDKVTIRVTEAISVLAVAP